MLGWIFLWAMLPVTSRQVPAPESRALAYLAREVPRWSSEHKCYSCHNNGDAARALYTAARLGYVVPEPALVNTSQFLAKPERWDDNGGKAGLSDKRLARIEFAAALVDALDARQIKDRRALRQAADLVAAVQQADGSWRAESENLLGSPATYGDCLATVQARRTLHKADPMRFAAGIAKADQWLRTVRVSNAVDAAAVLSVVAQSKDSMAVEQRRRCLALIRKGEADKGGWGPYSTSAPEPFDTAVVVLALVTLADTPDLKPLIERGRAYLCTTQNADGSWPETTRPAGAESYAQRLSTTGWAMLALLATNPHPGKG
jgi:hypothetical protein